MQFDAINGHESERQPFAQGFTVLPAWTVAIPSLLPAPSNCAGNQARNQDTPAVGNSEALNHERSLPARAFTILCANGRYGVFTSGYSALRITGISCSEKNAAYGIFRCIPHMQLYGVLAVGVREIASEGGVA